MSDLPPISPSLADLLDAEREISPIAPAQKERVLSRVLANLPPTPALPTPSAEGAGTLLGASLRGKIIGVGALLVGAVGGVLGDRALHRDGSDRSVATSVVDAPMKNVELVVRVETSTQIQPIAPSDASLPGDASPPPSSATATTKPAPNRVSETSMPSTDLKRERLLLETARAAIQRRDAASAKAALSEHARLFPRGQLAEERALLLRAMSETSPD